MTKTVGHWIGMGEFISFKGLAINLVVFGFVD